jgi:MOSC domain-containing protein YiiM
VAVNLLSVNIGRAALIGEREGKVVRSAIKKTPVGSSTIEVGLEGLAGDEQRDRRVHGGPTMAVHAFPYEHLRAWERELGRAVPPGFVGENLTVEGLLEQEVRIGDRYRWGEVELRVSKQRTPCFKLDLVFGVEVVPVAWTQCRTGWYFSVLKTGVAPTAGPLELLARGDGSTISNLVTARMPIGVQRKAR